MAKIYNDITETIGNTPLFASIARRRHTVPRQKFC